MSGGQLVRDKKGTEAAEYLYLEGNGKGRSAGACGSAIREVCKGECRTRFRGLGGHKLSR